MAKNQQSQADANKNDPSKDSVDLTKPVVDAAAKVLDPDADNNSDGAPLPGDSAAVGFQLVQNLDVIAGNMDIAYENIQALLKQSDDEGGVPDALVDFTVKPGVLERYVAHANAQDLDLTKVDLIIADPDTDPVLKSLNFHRSMQGLKPSFMYLRFPS